MTTVLEQDHLKFHNDDWKPRYCKDCWPGYEIEQPKPIPPAETPRRAPGGMRSFGEVVADLREKWPRKNPDWHGPIEEIDRDMLPWCTDCGSTRWKRLAPNAQPGESGFGEIVQCSACFEYAVMPRWMDKLWGDLPELFKAWEWETFPVTVPRQQEIIDNTKALIADPRRPWGAFTGQTGRGKTGIVVCAAKTIIREQRRAVKLVNAPSILNKLRASYDSESSVKSDEILQSLQEIPVLIIDDLGQENDNSWAVSALYSVISGRHDNKMQTLITSNWPVVDSKADMDLARKLNVAIARRIHEMTREPRYRMDFDGLPYLSNAG